MTLGNVPFPKTEMGEKSKIGKTTHFKETMNPSVLLFNIIDESHIAFIRSRTLCLGAEACHYKNKKMEEG